MDTLRQDIRYACRRLTRTPGFALVAIVTIALGIGANSAIFSVVHGVLLKPLPYAEPERLVALFHVYAGHHAEMSGPNFTDLAGMSETLAGASGISTSRAILTGQGDPVRLDTAEVSANLFELLGVHPLLGRTFHADENQPGRTKVVILSYGLWHERFGGDRGVIGRRITLDETPREVIGVMPKDFAYPAGRVLWLPLEYDASFTKDQRAAWYLDAIGRARPGVPIPRVAAEIGTIGKRLQTQYPDANGGVEMTAVPLHEATVGDVRTAVQVLLGAVGFVLLIACVNVANLLLARAAARETEMAVRSALGAGRGRLVRQLLTESVILSAAGGIIGLLLAVWGVAGLVALEPQGIPRLDEVRVDATVMAFTAALSAATGILFGLMPAFQSTRQALAGTLKEGARGSLGSAGGTRLRAGLIVTEMTLAVVLLAGAGLLIRSFARLTAVDPGFRTTQALTFELRLPDERYKTDTQQAAFFDQLLPHLRAIPGVTASGAVLYLPLTGSNLELSFEVAGRPPVPTSQQPAMQVRVATPDYFGAIGLPLARGRFLTDADRAGTPPVVVITESAARAFFPNEDPIGKRITLGWGRGPGTPRAGGQVVGIVGDVKDSGLSQADTPLLFLPYRQWPVHVMSVIVSTAVAPATVAAAVTREVHAIDPGMPVSRLRTLDTIVSRSISQPRFYMTVLALFAGVALVLAAVGIFGVLSYTVSQRTREIGIRIALGARERTVRRLIVRDAMLLSVTGVAIGIGAALLLVRQVFSTLLFSIGPKDPATFAGAAALLITVAFLASYVPARRATRVDPAVALRAE
jgi:putative ABC transport system permease protein